MAEVSNQPGDSEHMELWSFGHDDHDLIGRRSLGFWLYMMSDIMIYAGLFTAHRVYIGAFAGSFTDAQVLDPLFELLPTVLIFGSVLTFGLAMVELKNANQRGVAGWMLAAFVLGLAFLGLEIWSFADLAGRGAWPTESGFLSDYWTIIWAHGAHVFFGLVWMLVMLVQVTTSDLSELVVARLVNLRIFWFFQAVMWIAVYFVVYLLGVA